MPEVKIHLELILPAERLSVNALIALFQQLLRQLVPQSRPGWVPGRTWSSHVGWGHAGNPLNRDPHRGRVLPVSPARGLGGVAAGRACCARRA